MRKFIKESKGLSDGDTMLKHLESNERIMFKELAKALGYIPTKLRERLKNKTHIDKKLLLAIYAVSGITPEEMGLPNYELKTALNPKLLNQDEEAPLFFSFSDWQLNTLKEDHNYSIDYYNALIETLNKSSDGSEIIVYDYFLNNILSSSKRDIEKYFMGFKEYLKKIEEVVEKKSLKYTRIIALPLHKNILLDFKHYSVAEPEVQAICLLSKSMYRHLQRCFICDGVNFKLCVTDRPSRTFSVMLMDNYLLSEYYRVKNPFPGNVLLVNDILFIEKVAKNNITERMYTTYENEFRKFTSESVSKENFKRYTERGMEICNFLQKEVENNNDVASVKYYDLLNKTESMLNQNMELWEE